MAECIFNWSILDKLKRPQSIAISTKLQILSHPHNLCLMYLNYLNYSVSGCYLIRLWTVNSDRVHSDVFHYDIFIYLYHFAFFLFPAIVEVINPPLDPWFSFLMPWPFNTLSYVVVTQNHKTIFVATSYL